MTDDIVKRLRTAQPYTTRDGEAADEIERLRAELAASEKACVCITEALAKACAERDALRALLRELRPKAVSAPFDDFLNKGEVK